MVTLHTIDGGTVNAINDALLYDFIIGQNGIATGATVTSEGALLLHIDSGWGVIKGRIFSIEAETVSATPSTSGTVKGRLILQIDITNTTNPITFVTQAAATLPALQQEDINGNGTIYQLPIATYDVNEVAVSNLQMVAPVVEAINKADSTKLIWTNPNPSDIFNPTTLTLPDNYKYIIIEFAPTTTSNDRYYSIVFTNPKTVICSVVTDKIVSRKVLLNNNVLQFYDGIYSNAIGSQPINNAAAIPKRVFGIT